MSSHAPNHFVHFLVRRRVPISIVAFGLLMARDFFSGTIPRDVLDWNDGRSMVGLVSVLLGLAIRSWAAGFLIKSTELTTVGPYRVVRNPLYLGSFLMVIGFCLLLNDRLNLWIAAVLLILLYVPKVRSEERYLAGQFPKDWAQYAASTPRFLPRLTVPPSVSGWRMALWLKSREYNAVAASAVGIVALKIVHDWHV